MTSAVAEFHPAAELELEAAAEWYAQRSKAAPVLFLNEVDHAINLILLSPKRWPLGPRGTRSFFLHRFPYVIVYRRLLHSIMIIAVAHEKRRPGYWRGRI